MGLASLLVPLYMYPSSSAWSSIYTQISNNPSITFNLIINPDSGPGSDTTADSNWVTGISKLNAYSNTQLLGYVHTSYGSRSISDVESDIATYSSWSSYSSVDMHLDGIFFDEAPETDDSTDVSYMTTAAKFVRSNMSISGSSPYVTFNPGVAVSSDYYSLADMVLACEDTWSDFKSSPSSYISAVSSEASKSAFMINTFTGSSSDMTTLVNELYAGSIGTMYVTTSSDYSGFGSDLSIFVSAVAAGGSATASSSSSSSTATSKTSSSTSSKATTTSSSTSSKATTKSSSTSSKPTTTSSSTSSKPTTSSSSTSSKTSSTSSSSTVTATPTPTNQSTQPQANQANQGNQGGRNNNNSNGGHRRNKRWIPRSWGAKALDALEVY